MKAKQPTTTPKTPRECYEFLSEPLQYEGESDEEWASRKNLTTNFTQNVLAMGLTIEEHLRNQERTIILHENLPEEK